jgi:hypothetical protein
LIEINLTHLASPASRSVDDGQRLCKRYQSLANANRCENPA